MEYCLGYSTLRPIGTRRHRPVVVTYTAIALDLWAILTNPSLVGARASGGKSRISGASPADIQNAPTSLPLFAERPYF